MDSDKLLIEMLSNQHKPFMIIMTKADKVKDQEVGTQLNKTAEFIKGAGLLCSPVIHGVSSYSGYGMLELMANLAYIAEMPTLRKPK